MHIIFVYIGILFGIFLEGEMIMISSVIAAHHGYLNIWLVVILGVLGTYCSDCFYFFLGRNKGKDWLNKKQKFKNKAGIIDKKLEKHPIIIFMSYRFLYGFRTITPLVIGASKTKTYIFLLYSAVSTLIWAITYCTIGYLFGEVIKSKLGSVEHIEKYIIGFLLLVGIIVIVINRVKKQNKNVDLQNTTN